MCLGIPAEIVALGADDLATVAVDGVRREVSVGLLRDEPVAVGDWVLVHVGFALSRIDQAEAAATLASIKQLGQVFAEDWQAFADQAGR